jgi:hypothetical protein
MQTGAFSSKTNKKISFLNIVKEKEKEVVLRMPGSAGLQTGIR